MRILALFTAAAFAASAGAALAQLVDPRSAAGAAGEINGQPAPSVDTPTEVDRSADPAVRPPAQPGRPMTTLPGATGPGAGASTSPALPAEPDARTNTPAPPPAAGGPPRARTTEEDKEKDRPPAVRGSPANPALSEPRPLVSPSPPAMTPP